MPARIASFIRNGRPNTYCDYCLSTALGIDLKVVAKETRVLEREPGFARARAVCSYCGSLQPVITATVP